MKAADSSQMNSPEPEYLTPEQLSAKLQMARKTIKKWTIARRIPGQIKFGGRWRYSRLAIEKAIQSGEFLNPGNGC